jgi:hypothetical protein
MDGSRASNASKVAEAALGGWLDAVAAGGGNAGK